MQPTSRTFLPTSNPSTFLLLPLLIFFFSSPVMVFGRSTSGDYRNNGNHDLIINGQSSSVGHPFRLNQTNAVFLVCNVAFKDLQIGCTAEAGDGFNPLDIKKPVTSDHSEKEHEDPNKKLDKDWCTTYCHFLGCLKLKIPSAAMDCPREDHLRGMVVGTEEFFHERCSTREPDGSYNFVCNGGSAPIMKEYMFIFVVLLFTTFAIFF